MTHSQEVSPGHEDPPMGGSERYELDEFLSGTDPVIRWGLKVAGIVLLVTLLVLVLAYPFSWLR